MVHNPRMENLMSAVKPPTDTATIGRLRRINAAITAPAIAEGNIRADPSLEPMGALGDLGWDSASCSACVLPRGRHLLRPLHV